MDLVVLALALVVMLIGLVGVVVPVLPGLLLVWLATCGTLLWQGTDVAGWAAAAVMTVLFALGTVATIYLPARRGRAGGMTATTAAAVLAGAGIGFVVLPVVGLLVGAGVGLYLGERARLGDPASARSSALAVVRAYGVGVLVELGLGVAMIAVWAVTVLVRL